MKLLILAFAFIASSSAFAGEPVKVSPPQQKVLSSPNGRYVFGQISDYRRDQYMLDTQTGRLWRVVSRTEKEDGSSEKEGVEILQTIPYSGLDGKLFVIPK